MGYTNSYSGVCRLEFHLKKDLDGTLSEIEKLEEIRFQKEFKDAVKIIDGIISEEEDIGVVGSYLRSLLACIMYWTAKKARSWSEKVTEEIEDKGMKSSHKLNTLFFYTIDYIREIIYLSDRCIELILGKEG